MEGGSYGVKNIGGRSSKLTKRDRSVILRQASDNITSASKIRANLTLGCSIRTIQRAIKSSKHIVYENIARKPPLTHAHKKARLDYARQHITWTKK